MKASDLRPCDRCGGPLGFIFHLVRSSLVVVDQQAVRQHVGLTAILGGSEKLAAVFTPQPEIATVAGEHDPKLWTDLLLCTECYSLEQVSIAYLVEKREKNGERADERAAAL